MPLTYQVPAEDQTADGSFSFPLTCDGRTEVFQARRQLDENDLATLKLLAKKIGLIRGISKLRRFDLACAIAPYVFFTTREEAVAAWPILATPLEDTESDLRDQSMSLRACAGWLDPLYTAHFRTREAEVGAAIRTLAMEAERAAIRKISRQSGDDAPDWWKAGNFVPSDEWDEASAPAHPYLRIVVEVTERNHDGYCSSIDEDLENEHFYCCYGGTIEIEETVTLYTGCLPLRDPHGDRWEFLCPAFDPGWRCASGGSGVCGVRPSVRFVSMTRVQ